MVAMLINCYILDSAQARAYGEFSLIHVPAGLYSAIFRAPVTVLRSSSSWTLKFPYIQNNVYGMSIFVTSPYLLSLFAHKWSSFEKRERNLLIAILVSALFVFSYFGLGPYPVWLSLYTGLFT